ncbi:MAG: hypothetical protein HFI67_00490 [Lachnospiraceae bacterium]|jgi:hypothetical protein|nr:hypothetical protein [Lachnospiraceae bacterium]
MEQRKQYDNCLSLGWFCGTASSLSKLGLRNFSGPFDWYFSDFDSVITQIDNEFTDFMIKENLEIIENRPTEFKDKKYNFYCVHDVKDDFDKEYADIYHKYIKRAKRFIESIKNPTCFFRAVRSEKEIKYIVNNTEYIENVLKRYNSSNSIIYILLNGMSPLPNNFKWFRLTLEQYIGKTYEMRNMFNQSEELLLFCGTLLKPEQIKLNKKFDSQQNQQTAIAAVVNYYISNDIDGIDQKISDVFKLQNSESFYIWGGGKYGILLYHYLRKRNVKVKAIIDNRPKNEFPSDICVISPNDIEPDSKIFIAVSNEISNSEIKKQVKNKKCHFLTYKELPYDIE